MEVQSFLKWHCRPPPFPLPRFPPHLLPSSQSLVLSNAKKSTHFQNHKPSFPSSCRRSKSLSISAAAAVALQTDKDRLPDDIQVTETKEPHSRVEFVSSTHSSFLSFVKYGLWLQ